MSKITEPGTYRVTLQGCHWEPCKAGHQAVLPGYLDGEHGITAFQSATPTIIQNGQHRGKKLAQVTYELLCDLGLPNGDPAQIAGLDGTECEFVVDWDEYQGKKRLQVRFVNSPRAAADPAEVASFFAQMGLGPESAGAPVAPTAVGPAAPLPKFPPTPAAPPNPDTEDDIPF